MGRVMAMTCVIRRPEHVSGSIGHKAPSPYRLQDGQWMLNQVQHDGMGAVGQERAA